jgi:3'(2'), 5'-bisphosphate nucleotidase
MFNAADLALPTSTTSDVGLAVELADAAGYRLRQIRAKWRGDVGTLRVAAYEFSHGFLASSLVALRPTDAVLSEDRRDDPARLTADRVWIIAPLDGTREFGERGRTDWGVHVALWQRGELVAGAVALPARGMVLASDGSARMPERAPGPLRIAVSRTRPPDVVDVVADALGAALVPMGSAGVKAAAVVRGEVDAYIDGGRQFEWDSAAPVAVACAAGAHASRVDGSPLRYNAPDPLLPDLVVCRPELAAHILSALRATMADDA